MSTTRPTSPARRNGAALDAFLARHLAVQDLLSRLQAASDDHWHAGDPDAVDWGHVGTVASIEDLLRQAVASLPSPVTPG